MATALRSKLSYHRRLFLLLLAFSWTLVACFVTFQYGREKRFKAERLDARLQLFNLRMLDALADGIPPAEFAAAHSGPYPGLRITLIGTDGRVTFDNSADSLPAANHLGRPEIAEALARGTGFTIRRHSESTHRFYFYSAMRGDSLVVRSAVPYSLSLREVLAADREFLWFMLGVTLLMSVAAYFATRRLGHNITRLNEFAERAERGEQIDEQPIFPHDELGDISNHIIRLYARLQRTTADRDREHALALHEEQEKIRIKKQLTNNISHELKTPVTAIQGYLETLLANPELPAARRTAFLEKGCAQTERLRSLLADISTVTRMDEASQLIRKEHVVLNDLVDEIRADMELRPEGRRLRVNCDFPGPIAIEGSPSLLASVFRNLADNAAAYSGGRDIFIRLLGETPEAYTLLFADNGIGVDEEHLPHLFERFYRIDKGRSRKLGGTGLGLSIVKNAVLIHGGTISVRNGERGGLEFVFTLRKHS
ncbi:HAMP domain-containing sensor histidine kinase [uncultured Alistipes sp.]|jgi:two-component system OmpR family sensor kinase|uniref:sensor histidine kinase n=1 Tax=uncultured Alistipes sp. TaxID=538949 RepID=UPI0025E105A9|nr:HAMP domain-containing sensor histidine kinase [uncultured Alistipes sp.]